MPTLFPPEEVLRSGCDRCREEVAFALVVYHPFCKFRLAPMAGSARRSV